MDLISIKTKSKKRPGRGISAGQGKTAGRGTKGQKARAGYDLPNRFEGGQTPLSMRLPKLPGFKSHNKKAINLSLALISAHYKNGETVSYETLYKKGIINSFKKVKILNNGELKVKVSLADDVLVTEAAKSLFNQSVQESSPSAKTKE